MAKSIEILPLDPIELSQFWQEVSRITEGEEWKFSAMDRITIFNMREQQNNISWFNDALCQMDWE